MKYWILNSMVKNDSVRLICIEKVTCRITLHFIKNMQEIETPKGFFRKLSLLDGAWRGGFLRFGWVRLYCSITKETCFVCPRNYLVTYWLAQLENVSYLAFAVIREHELLVEILSLRSLDEFSPKSAADLSLFAYVRCWISCCIAPMFG